MTTTGLMLQIRPASLEDVEAVHSIGCTTYLEHFAHCWSPAGLQRFLQRDFSPDALRVSLASPEHTWLLAQTPDAVVGYAKINWHRREPDSGRIGAELQKIYFLASAAGRGYGTALLDEVIRNANEHAESLLWLNVLKTNADAQRFYTRHGFDTTGALPFRNDLGEDIGMWVMTRTLSNNA